MGIEAISRNLEALNLFVTVNFNHRAWPDARRLLYELKHGGQTMERDKSFDNHAAEFTKLASKYAPHLAMRACLTDICGIPDKEDSTDWTEAGTTELTMDGIGDASNLLKLAAYNTGNFW